jgi:sugar phosphate isomerase/epimerase
MKFGCHAVMFGPMLATATETVFEKLSKTGFSGIEMGARFMGAKESGRIIESAEKWRLEIAAIHVPSSFSEFADKPEEVIDRVLKIAEIAKGLKNKNISMSCLNKPSAEAKEPDPRLKDPAFVKKAAQGIGELVKRTKDMGVSLNYHNHYWEFENDCLLFNTLFMDVPDLNFCFDVGWVYSAGNDPIEIIERNTDRFPFIHLRDYSNEFKEFVNLGEGDLDYSRLLKTLNSNQGKCEWAIVEYEQGQPNYKRYTTARIFIENLMGSLDR